MEEDPAEPKKTLAEVTGIERDAGSVGALQKGIRPEYLIAAAVLVAAMVIVSMALIYSLLSGKEVRGAAYDILLKESNLPDGWSVGKLFADSATESISDAEVWWNNGPEGNGNITVRCDIYVYDDLGKAKEHFTGLALANGEQTSTIDAFGDEFYVMDLDPNDNEGLPLICFREANAVVTLYASHE